METLSTILMCLLVGLIWGTTNALIERGVSSQNSSPKPKVERVWIIAVLYDLLELLLNWRVTLPYIANQAGSVLYYFTLGGSEMSLAVPLANSATLVWTLLASLFLSRNEDKHVDI